jgi:hypothetical protein
MIHSVFEQNVLQLYKIDERNKVYCFLYNTVICVQLYSICDHLKKF